MKFYAANDQSYNCVLNLQFHYDDYRPVKAHRQFDYYSICVMIISILCENDWCMEKLVCIRTIYFICVFHDIVYLCSTKPFSSCPEMCPSNHYLCFKISFKSLCRVILYTAKCQHFVI